MIHNAVVTKNSRSLIEYKLHHIAKVLFQWKVFELHNYKTITGPKLAVVVLERKLILHV